MKSRKPPLLLNPTTGADGHKYIDAADRDGYLVSFRVDRLVLTAFGGPPPAPDAEPHHLDDDPQNCELDNLRWRLGDEVYPLPSETH